MRLPVMRIVNAIRRLWRPALTLGVLLLAMPACIEWKQPTAVEEATIANYVASVQTADGQAIAVLKTGVPSFGDGPVVTAPIPDLIGLGGTIQVFATSPLPFTKVAVTIPGVNDYWELTLPSPTNNQPLLLVFGQNIPKTVFDLHFAGSSGGAYGAVQSTGVNVITVGTGDVQVNITWDSKADVDLHVVDPSGAEIYWADRNSLTGGHLDLDSNAGCASDGPRAENVFWPSGLVAPHGDYIVRVDNWSSCGAGLTHYVVTVNAKGKVPRVFTGTFTDAGDGGSKGAGRSITLFSY
ncbi:MAG: hypothetical protein HYR75_04845 [Gemmatimonadetes bacterium]|nr:hypothetical protein [Gemmatimonadota bacterium]